MTNRTNKIQNEQIIADLTNNILDSHFSIKSKASGKDLLDLFPIQQVNLFVLQALFEKWNEETENFKSDYFDFSSSEVREVFEAFKNALSRNISIGKEPLRPLMQMALDKSILLYSNPIEFKKTNHISQNNSRFIKTYLDFLLNDGAAPDEKTIQENRNIFQDAVNSFGGPTLWADHPGKNLKDESPKEVALSPISVGSNKPNSKSTLHSSITLNQRIMFTKVLFLGNKDEFDVTIGMIDSLNDFDVALEFVKNRFAVTNGWDFESDEVTEFLELLERRFS